MATEFNFTFLISTVTSYIERGGAVNDPTVAAYLPTAVNLVERQMARELKLQGFQRLVLSTMQAGLSVYQKPDRWRETVSMSIGTATPSGPGNIWVPIYGRDYEYVRQVYTNSTTTGVPKYYAEMDYSHWWFGPTPDAAYPWQAVYWELPPLLDVNNQSNWTSLYAPNALLHGTLAEVYGYLKKPDERQIWQTAYDRDMAALAGEEVQKILDRMQERTSA